MPRRTITRAVVAIVVAGALLLHATPPAEAAPAAVDYLPPVDAPLVDTFRPPATRYGPGNRGVDYGTAPGQPVTAAAAGEVVFSGWVGNGLHVVVRHADGVRTSYSFLGGTEVRRGDQVEQGQPIGTAATDGTPLHFGARAPTPDDEPQQDEDDAYLDPLVLLGQRPDPNQGDDGPHAHLVADPHPERPLTEAEERSRLERMLRGIGNGAGKAVGWARDRAGAAIEDKLELAAVLLDDFVDLNTPIPVYAVVAALRWHDEQATCTKADTPVPRAPAQRRIAVLVGGLGSATGDAAVLDTDTQRLGYADGDVYQFSYRRDRDTYRPEDTTGDLAAAARNLTDQLDAVAAANPGVPVDVIAHSQGGLVARAAVVLHGARPSLLATLGTPHHGADLATAEVGLHLTTVGADALDAVSERLTEPVAGLDLDQTSIQQMSETSRFIEQLDRTPLPSTTPTRTISIAVRGDQVVANHQSRLEGAANAVITTTGALNEHDGLPGADATTDELLRALAGQQPTCRTLVDALADEVIGRQTSQLHDQVGAALTGAALAVDLRAHAAGAGASEPAPPP